MSTKETRDYPAVPWPERTRPRVATQNTDRSGLVRQLRAGLMACEQENVLLRARLRAIRSRLHDDVDMIEHNP